MQKFMKKICAVMLSVAMIGSVMPQVVSAGESEYQIYPTPHTMTYESGSYELKDLNVIYGNGMDDATKARLEETAALLDLEVTEATTADAGKTNVYVAINGSDDAAANYIAASYNIDASLFTKTDANFVCSNNGEIVVLGKDVDACYYGLTTLYHVFTQVADGEIRNFTISDYADVVSRGFIEGYYGNPWSTEDRVNLMTWGGYYKLNSYFYAPKDDPKHNAKWKELYTDDEIETKIKPLAEAGNASKCRFVYALHPYMYNAIRHNNEANYQADLKAMQAKFEQVIDAGVRQIAILADDAANVGGANYTRMLTDMTAWIKEMQKKYPDLKLTLPFCTQEYMNWGETYYANFPENVQIVMTGGKVWGEVNNNFTSSFTNKVGRGPYLWINWPCTDNSKKHLIMGGYTTFLQAGVNPSNIQGIVLNPMQQSEPSKVAIFGNACYSWNIWESNEEAEAAWNASFSYVDHNSAIPNAASDALKELSKHMINQNMDSRVTALQESVELKDDLNSFKTKLAADTLTAADVDNLINEFVTLQNASITFRNEAGDQNLCDQIVYWLNCWDDTTTAAISYLNAVKAIVNNEEDDAIWAGYARGQEAFENSKSYGFHYVDHTEYAEVGVQHIVPFLETLDEYLAPIAKAIVDPTVGEGGSGAGTALKLKAFEGNNPAYYSGYVTNVADGDETTFVWYSQAGKVGQYIGVDLGAVVKIGNVRFVQDSGDKFNSYELQYSVDGNSYTTYKSYSDAVLDTDLSSANIEARYIKFVNKTATSNWVKIYEIAASAAASNTVLTNAEALKEYTVSVTNDLGKLTTTGNITLAANEYIGIDLTRIKDLATIDVEGQGTLTLEVSKNMVDWVEVSLNARAITTLEDARYVRLINKTDVAVTTNLSKFEVTSNEVTAPVLHSTTMGINSSWGVAEDCRNNGAAFDGNVSTMTEFGDLPQKGQYIIYDLGQVRDVYKLEIYCQDSAVNYIRDAVMSVSNDLQNWTDVLEIGDGVENIGDAGVKCIDSDAGYSQTTSAYPNVVSIEGTIDTTPARYLRILMTATSNERAVVFTEIEINEGEYVSTTNDPTFETSAIELQGRVPQNMIDGDLTTSYKANTTDAGYVMYTFSDKLDANRINIVQKGTSNAKVYLYAEQDGVRGWLEAGTLDKSLVKLQANYDLNLAMMIVWDKDQVPALTEIVRFTEEDSTVPTILPDPELDPREEINKEPEVTPTPEVTEAPQPTGTPEVKDDVTTVFDDVYKDWYTEYVQYVYDNSLMTGIKGTKHFAPNANITKAQVAQVLYNMEGQPAVTDKAVFGALTDVYAGEWYANAVAWAYNTGVVTGDLNTKKFNPNADVTREQLALMMFRYAGFKKYDVSASSDLAGLKNAENVNNWAADGVKWAVGAGLISGIEKDGVKDLAPQGNASRAQVAAILQRFCEAY